VNRGVLAAAALALALGLAACGDDDTATETTFRPNAPLTVSAPTSLQFALNRISSEDELKDTRMFFAGSDDQTQKIRDGVAPDVYLTDSPDLASGLLDDGLISEPVDVATDELVLAVPADSKIDALDDLAAPGTRTAIGQDGLPSGDYARAALAGLPGSEGDEILANATVEEPNNNAIVIDLNAGDADAGFVYASDVFASNQTDGDLRTIKLPPDLPRQVVYSAAVTDAAENPPGAQEFVDNLLTQDSATTFGKTGFGPPPSG
jgi:molybdate transport system substrate-binding protein